MPTLEANTKLENIEKSINAYISTNIQTALSLKVIYQRGAREASLPNHWVEIGLVPLSAQTAYFFASGTTAGALSQFLVNLNIFERDDARKSGAATAYTLSGHVDSISALFAPGSSITIRDYDTSGTPAVGALRSIEIPDRTEIDTPPDSGITQINVSATLLYVAETVD